MGEQTGSGLKKKGEVRGWRGSKVRFVVHEPDKGSIEVTSMQKGGTLRIKKSDWPLLQGASCGECVIRFRIVRKSQAECDSIAERISSRILIIFLCKDCGFTHVESLEA
jgi:hypothetical protein